MPNVLGSDDETKSRPTRAFTRAGRLNEALTEIEIALAALDADSAKPDQLADLADAIDAFKERHYGVAAALARASTRPRRQLGHHRRPDSMAQTIAEMRQEFARTRAAADAA